MIQETVSAVVALAIALRLRRQGTRRKAEAGESNQIRRSVEWGFAVVTLPLLGYLGIMRYAHGLGVPSGIVVIPTLVLMLIVLFASPIEITGNVILDGVLQSAGLLAVVFTLVNGVPALAPYVSAENVYGWALICLIAAVPARVIIWAVGGDQ